MNNSNIAPDRQRLGNVVRSSRIQPPRRQNLTVPLGDGQQIIFVNVDSTMEGLSAAIEKFRMQVNAARSLGIEAPAFLAMMWDTEMHHA